MSGSGYDHAAVHMNTVKLRIPRENLPLPAVAQWRQFQSTTRLATGEKVARGASYRGLSSHY